MDILSYSSPETDEANLIFCKSLNLLSSSCETHFETSTRLYVRYHKEDKYKPKHERRILKMHKTESHFAQVRRRDGLSKKNYYTYDLDLRCTASHTNHRCKNKLTNEERSRINVLFQNHRAKVETFKLNVNELDTDKYAGMILQAYYPDRDDIKYEVFQDDDDEKDQGLAFYDKPNHKVLKFSLLTCGLTYDSPNRRYKELDGLKESINSEFEELRNIHILSEEDKRFKKIEREEKRKAKKK